MGEDDGEGVMEPLEELIKDALGESGDATWKKGSAACGVV